MALRSNIVDEIRRAPLATILATTGVIVALLSLGLAWLQYRATVPQATSTGSASFINHLSEVGLGNILLVVAYFLAVTISISLFLRMLGRKHDITAFFVSIPLIALSNFSTILVLYLAPPRPITRQLFVSAHDLIFYSAIAIVISFCGGAVLRNFAENASKPTTSNTEQDSTASDGIGLMVVVLLILSVWSWLVFSGQSRLTRTLLPEVTYPTESQAPKAGA
ncbi:hypothetical protein XCY_000124 [Xanthomonas euroxanthea]|uniref:hypothetical protein n=1 Tax=Xanthomonas euroxanthea TaxID=2259622 RepID=UPI001AFA1761|nr:hypothetical protein [Xanthomonas euroxanthea]CAG2082416.1 hypothetical protein XCY_000124 [Xanthomonas euroxanthea]